MVQEARLMDIMIDGLTNHWLTKQEANDRVSKIIENIGMTKIGRFVWIDTDIGASLYQMIMESHIAMDYMDSVVWIHLSSCKPYNYFRASQELIEAFEIHTLLSPVLLIRRGLQVKQHKEPYTEEIKGLELYHVGVTPA